MNRQASDRLPVADHFNEDEHTWQQCYWAGHRARTTKTVNAIYSETKQLVHKEGFRATASRDWSGMDKIDGIEQADVHREQWLWTCVKAGLTLVHQGNTTRTDFFACPISTGLPNAEKALEASRNSFCL